MKLPRTAAVLADFEIALGRIVEERAAELVAETAENVTKLADSSKPEPEVETDDTDSKELLPTEGVDGSEAKGAASPPGGNGAAEDAPSASPGNAAMASVTAKIGSLTRLHQLRRALGYQHGWIVYYAEKRWSVAKIAAHTGLPVERIREHLAAARMPELSEPPPEPEPEDPEPEAPAPSVARIRKLVSHPKAAGEPRARTIAGLRLTRDEQRAAAIPSPVVERPRTRGDCIDGPRPCPFVSCVHHLYLDVSPAGSIKLNFPAREVHELTETCSLDVADRGGVTLEEVGALINITRERARQIEALGLAAFAADTDFRKSA